MKKRPSCGRRGAKGKNAPSAGQINKRKTVYFFAEVLCLCGVVAAALFTPQMIFGVQDGILCGATVLSQRESTNAEALATAYEKSLAVRMRNYADALAEGESFYVTSQVLQQDESLERYLSSESGLYTDMILKFIDAGLLPDIIWNRVYPYRVNQWKQYVIYSDNYARGVNFILWYVEMVSDEGGEFKLLADAEDGTVYAVKAQGGSSYVYRQNEMLPEFLGQAYYSTELWELYVRYYEAWTQEETEEFIEMIEAAEQAGLGEVDHGVSDTVLETESGRLLEIAGKVWYWLDGDNRMMFRLPFGDNSLEIEMNLGEMTLKQLPDYMYIYPDVTIGVRDIYEKIPEFA